MNENIKKALFLKFSNGIGNVSAKQIILNNHWDKVNFNDPEIINKVENELNNIENQKINVITLLDTLYPPLLKEIHDPPLLLYYEGNLEAKQPIAVVGTRHPSPYGEKSCRDIVKGLCKYGVEIISGFAYGIDGIAHKTTLENQSKTIAVLACGLDIAYPYAHVKLKNEIIASGGAVISEYPMGTKPQPYHFPIRNRIISGLAQGTIVIEAKIESGALITAKYAGEQGRSVYTIPGSIFQESFYGNHTLIREGGILIRKAEDVLEDLQTFSEKKLIKKTIKLNKEEMQETVRTHADDSLFAYLNEEEKLIMECFSEKTTLDYLLAKTGFSPSKILSLLTQLNIKGLLEEKGGIYYKS